MKITVVEPLPWNKFQGLKVKSNLSLEPSCNLEVESEYESIAIELEEPEIQKLIQVLQGVLEGKEVHNG